MANILKYLYGSYTGRFILTGLTNRNVSKAAGLYLDSYLSKPLIYPFAKKNNIDLSICKREKIYQYKNFNDFFTRELKDDERPVNMDPNCLIAPCDGLLSAYRITEGLVIPVKQSCYRIKDLLHSSELAKEFNGGIALVYRLCVNHYHRYVYVESGIKGHNHFINGVLHTVRPIALRTRPVFIENCREFTVIKTSNMGKMVQMEVGAMLVGKIDNYDLQMKKVSRGKEKGRFLYGGSTIIVLIDEEHAKYVDPRLIKATIHRKETPVRLGQSISRI